MKQRVTLTIGLSHDSILVHQIDNPGGTVLPTDVYLGPTTASIEQVCAFFTQDGWQRVPCDATGVFIFET